MTEWVEDTPLGPHNKTVAAINHYHCFDCWLCLIFILKWYKLLLYQNCPVSNSNPNDAHIFPDVLLSFSLSSSLIIVWLLTGNKTLRIFIKMSSSLFQRAGGDGRYPVWTDWGSTLCVIFEEEQTILQYQPARCDLTRLCWITTQDGWRVVPLLTGNLGLFKQRDYFREIDI